MTRASTSGFLRSSRAVWLFPPTYAVHLVEEYAAGGGFSRWMQRAFGVHMSDAEFVAWNVFAFVLMCVGTYFVVRNPRLRFIELAMAVAVLGNASLHVLGSVLTWTYSPGLVTGTVIWAPLGWIRSQAVSRTSSRRERFAGTCIGVCAILAVLAVLAANRH